LKTENIKAPFPLTIYEANIACILNGYGKIVSLFSNFVLDKKYDPITKKENVI